MTLPCQGVTTGELVDCLATGVGMVQMRYSSIPTPQEKRCIEMPLGDDMMATLNHEISKSARNSEQLHMFARLLDWTIPILAFAGGIGTLTKSPQTILLGSAAFPAAVSDPDPRSI